MPRPNRTLLAVILAALAVPAASSALPIRVVLMGDSITAGGVAGDGMAYADSLTQMLGSDYAVSNVACGGLSSLDWTLSNGSALCGAQGFIWPNIYTGRAQPELPAEIVTIMLGTNDSVGYLEPEPVSPSDYGSALAEISTNLFADGADWVVLMTPPPNFWNPSASLLLREYRDEVLALCGSEAGIICGPDVFTLLDTSDFIPMNVHPNAMGHAKIANALFETIVTIPEPSTAPLLAFGLVATAMGRRRRANR